MAAITYKPPPTIKAFIKHYRAGELFHDWITGPFGSGKTTGVFFKLVYMAKLQAKSPIDGIRRSRCVVVRNTAPQLNDNTLKSFNYWFRDGVAGEWKATAKTFVLKFGDVECEVLFRPLDTPDDVQRVLGLEVTFAIVDEFVQVPQGVIEALSGRCGRYPPDIEGGATNWGMWGASNPGSESTWWYPLLEDHSLLPPDQEVPDNWAYFKQPSGLSPEAENVEHLPGKAAYYTNLAKGKTRRWVRQFIECEWIDSENGKPVYPMFDPAVHISKRPLAPLKHLPLLAGYDPGNHSAVILGQYDHIDGRVMILRELVLEGYATDRMIRDKLKPLLAREFPGYEFLVIPDPSSVNRAQGASTSVMLELKKHFAVHYDSDNSTESRVAPMQYYMMRLTNSGPALIIDPSCVKLKRALAGGYKYTVSKDGDKQKDVPEKNIHSHVAEACQYLVRYCRKGEEKAGKRIASAQRPMQTPRNPYNMR